MYCEKEVRENYRKLTLLLIENNLSISTMESATSGQLASLITDTEGASTIFRGSLVTYSNEMKIRMGVPSEIIERYSVYSKEVATEMARVCRETFGTDIGIGITGTMGNVDPENEISSIPGQVYFAIGYRDVIEAYYVEIPAQETRLDYKLAVAEEIYNELMKVI